MGEHGEGMGDDKGGGRM